MRLTLLFLAILTGATAHADFKGDVIPFSVLGGAIDGMVVTRPLPPKSGLRRLGVQKGDTVIAIDQRDINTTEGMKLAYNATSLQSVTLLRNGKKILLGKNHE